MPVLDNNSRYMGYNPAVIGTERNPQKEAEAMKTLSGQVNIGGTGLSGAEYIASRGGINSEGYYNDVPAYQQLTNNERRSVTLPNGNIDTLGMLDILNKKEAKYNESIGKKVYTPIIEDSDVDAIPLSPSSLSSSPSNISPVTQTPPPPPVKTAPIDTILFDDDTVPIQIMADLIFENIGGQELINIARNDTVNGQTVIYQPIKNLTTIQQEYNPNNIVALQATSDKYFQNFSIKLDNKVPSPGTGPDGAHVYIDPETGDLVVEAVNLDPDEQIELEITVSGTIYEAEL